MNNPTDNEKLNALIKKLKEELTILDAEVQFHLSNIKTLINEIDLILLK